MNPVSPAVAAGSMVVWLAREYPFDRHELEHGCGHSIPTLIWVTIYLTD